MELINVSKSFKEAGGQNNVLKNISYSFDDRGIVSIEGKSGSGKSTLLNLMASFDKPTKGEIKHKGHTISKLKKEEINNFRNKECGFVFQHFNLISNLTVLENIILPLLIGGEKKNDAEEKALGLLDSFGLKQFSGREVSTLSGGEKQRIALIRAFITNPSILLCDEPTGALDEENSVLVMKMLKDYSKKALVIVVTHNPLLSKKYCETRLKLENGQLIEIKKKKNKTIKQSKIETNRNRKKSWLNMFLKKNMVLDIKKNIFGFLSVFFAYFSLLLSFSFIHGSNLSIERERNTSALYDVFTVSDKKIYEIPSSPLRLSRSERPSKFEIERLLGDKGYIANDYSYFVPQYSAFKLDGNEQDSCAFSPVMNLDEAEILSGNRGDSGSFCAINEPFAKKYSAKIGSTISFICENSINHEGKTQDIYIEMEFKVTAIIHEFPFLSTPQAYYSYSVLDSLMESYELKNIEEGLTIKSFVDASKGNSIWSSYRYYVFSSKRSDSNEIRKMIDAQGNEGITISSLSYESEKAFSDLISSTALSILPFLVIEVLGAIFIIGAVSYSSFLERRKESAILSSFGANKRDIASIYLIESSLVSIVGAFASLVAATALTYALNPLLGELTGFSSLLNIPLLGIGKYLFIVELALVFISIVSSIIGSGIPILFSKQDNIIERLKDE
ncbi:MAG: ABC transporter ATP-binding protein/permease [Bacilli bacterium]|nr:ABC transporter ATP-binding protein/permease [Bacilli bacterium]